MQSACRREILAVSEPPSNFCALGRAPNHFSTHVQNKMLLYCLRPLGIEARPFGIITSRPRLCAVDVAYNCGVLCEENSPVLVGTAATGNSNGKEKKRKMPPLP